jgi:hypothetical protein
MPLISRPEIVSNLLFFSTLLEDNDMKILIKLTDGIKKSHQVA